VDAVGARCGRRNGVAPKEWGVSGKTGPAIVGNGAQNVNSRLGKTYRTKRRKTRKPALTKNEEIEVGVPCGEGRGRGKKGISGKTQRTLRTGSAD